MPIDRRLSLRLLGCVLLASGCFGTAGDDGLKIQNRLFFVDANNNTGLADGTMASPFIRIADALAKAIPGDTIQVLPGTYTENLVLTVGVNLFGDSASTTIIQGSGSAPVITALSVTGATIISGFTLTGGAGINPGSALFTEESVLTLRECIVTLNDSSGSAKGNAGAIFFRKGVCIVRQCAILNNIGNGIGTDGSGELLVVNSLIAVTTNHGIHVLGDSTTKNPDIELQNVTVYGVAGQGAVVDNFGDADFTNVILAATGDRGIREGNLGGDPLLLFNDMPDGYRDADLDMATTDPAVINSLTPPGLNTGNLVADPLFVDAAGGNFQLAPGSPCIDTGSPALVDTDLTRSDMGAFGGPGGNWDPTFAASGMATGLSPLPTAGPELLDLMDADPATVTAGILHRTDLDSDGLTDTLWIDPATSRLHLWYGTPTGRRPGLLPPVGLVRRATTCDLDGDLRADLLVEGVDGVFPYVNTYPFGGGISVSTSPGDIVEVDREGRSDFESPGVVRTTASGHPDGITLVGIGTADRVSVRVLRHGREVQRWNDVRPRQTLSQEGQ